MVLLSFICGMSIFSSPAWSPCQSLAIEDHPLYIQSLEINPKLAPEYRAEVVRSIFRASGRHQVNPKKLFAIIAQESKFRVGAINRKSHDYGIGQINRRTIRAFGFDKNRLLRDVNYSVDAAAFVLADFKKRHGKREPNFWSRYNSGDPEKRQEYEILVARFM